MSSLHQAVAEATDEVLSTMFFTMLDAPPETAANEPCLRVRVNFRGRWTGTLALCASLGASAEMAANFLGLDGPDSPAAPEQEAVAKELANMICGAALSRLDNKEVFELLPPVVCELVADEELPLDTESQVAEQTYGVGAGFLQLKLRLDRPA